MVPFDRMDAGKKLPGKHGQQDLSAARSDEPRGTQPTETTSISGLARLSL
jgi:hypothetical protein